MDDEDLRIKPVTRGRLQSIKTKPRVWLDPFQTILLVSLTSIFVIRRIFITNIT